MLSISCVCLDPSFHAQLGLSSRAFYHAAWGAVYRKDYLLSHNLQFPEGQKKAQDSVFNTQAYYYAKKVAYLPYVMYYYRNNPKGITRRYSADLPEVQQSLLLHLDACIRTFFPNDPDVEARYLNNRITSVLIDLMRLYVFHKDNPSTRKERKKAFFSLIESEPYHTALQCFDPKTSGRWRWHLPVALMRKKQFALLDLFVGSESLYRILCAIDKRISEFENALGKDLRKAKW